jgi:hypothetical protein
LVVIATGSQSKASTGQRQRGEPSADEVPAGESSWRLFYFSVHDVSFRLRSPADRIS